MPIVSDRPEETTATKVDLLLYYTTKADGSTRATLTVEDALSGVTLLEATLDAEALAAMLRGRPSPKPATAIVGNFDRAGLYRHEESFTAALAANDSKWDKATQASRPGPKACRAILEWTESLDPDVDWHISTPDRKTPNSRWTVTAHTYSVDAFPPWKDHPTPRRPQQALPAAPPPSPSTTEALTRLALGTGDDESDLVDEYDDYADFFPDDGEEALTREILAERLEAAVEAHDERKVRVR